MYTDQILQVYVWLGSFLKIRLEIVNLRERRGSQSHIDCKQAANDPNISALIIIT